ncbi:tetratricopeptide repeat protein [Microbulbifer yueqingensis]|uniref:Tetratricopeptide repeat-containing protein n=1 Tax=Microbulbifer yueqingensis TaxID=658219 RepID=A0A1G8Y9W3_9GAMM|nr:tetratricopeptide repeat protein [Microbulbifer yueqingensis]SDJ99473.1 Tetratricopeptide repeat-containing protein [Microbulbifer yueqingensis]
MKIIFAILGLLAAAHASADTCRQQVDQVLKGNFSLAKKASSIAAMENTCNGNEYHLLVLGQLHARAGEYGEAIAMVEGAGKVVEFPEEYAILAASSHGKLGRFDKAETIMQRYLRAHPDSPRAHLLLGEMQLQQKKFDPAVRSFIASIKLKPTPEAYISTARALYIVDNCGEAIVAIEQAASLDKATYGNIDAMVVASRCYASQGKFVVARNLLGVLAENNPRAEQDQQFHQAIAMLERDIRAAEAGGIDSSVPQD